MISECGHCGKKYQIDFNALRKKGFDKKELRFKCKACGHSVEAIDNSMQTQSPHSAPPVEKPLKPKAPPAHVPPIGPVRKRGMGLTPRVVLLMLLVSLIPLATLWIVTFNQTKKNIRNDTELIMHEISTGLSAQVDEWIDKHERILNILSGSEDIKSMDPYLQEPLLKATAAACPWMYLVFTIGTDGMNVARNDGMPLKDYHDRHYVQGALNGAALSWQTIVSRTNDKPAVVLSVPVKKQNETIGVLAAGANLEIISDQIAAWKKGNTGLAFLLDNTGKVVAHQSDEYVSTQKDLSNHPLIKAYKTGKRGAIYYTETNKKPFLGVVKETRQGWLLAVVQEEAEAFEFLNRAKLFAYQLLAATICVVFLLAWLVGNNITKPIKNITQSAQRVSIGDFNMPEETRRKDEIGDLALAIVRMQESIRLAMERLRKRSPKN